MGTRVARRQRDLNRVECVIGDEVHRHAALYPVFQRDYKVRGLIGFTPGQGPLWYPDIPYSIDGKTVRFKVPYADDAAKPIDGWDSDHLRGAYFCDPWQILAAAIAAAPNSGQLGEWRDLFRMRIPRGEIVDLSFEPALHRVRGVVVRRGLFGTRMYSTWEIPALADSLDASAAHKKGRHWFGKYKTE